MLQWFPGDPNCRIIFNVRRDGGFGCCVLDLDSGQKRLYDTPVYTISSDGRFALCPNFARLAHTRPGYGYEGVDDPWGEGHAPDDDGIYRLDFESGRRELIVSLRQIAGTRARPNMSGVPHWFNHLLIGPDNRRFIFLHRWRVGSGHQTRMFTVNVDGSGVYLLNDDEMTSHFIWRDPQTILAWARRAGCGDHYYYFRDGVEGAEVLAPDLLTADGHMSYRSSGEWIVTDNYPRETPPVRELILFNERTSRLILLAQLATLRPADISIRCDLHPRWSRDGRWITFDSLHEGTRQVYAAQVGNIVRPEGAPEANGRGGAPRPRLRIHAKAWC